MITITSISEFAEIRNVDIRLRKASQGGVFELHGEFDGYSDFFSIQFGDIEFASISAGFPLGGLLEGHASDILALVDGWRPFATEYAGRAIALWTADAPSIAKSLPSHRFVIVAGTIRCTPGADWDRALKRVDGNGSDHLKK